LFASWQKRKPEIAMPYDRFNTALIVGAGSGLSASLARLLAKEGIKVALAARTTGDLDALVKETGAQAYPCDASKRPEVEKLFADLDAAFGAPEIVIYNPSYRTRGPLIELDPAEVEKALAITAYGAFLVAQQAARRMLPKKRGAILFTGASAGVKGYAQSAPFAMGKFALRGLAQSMARELSPQGIHVAHFVIDGGIKSARRSEAPDAPASLLDPDAIAATYLHVLHQPHSAWTWEVELRPWVEKF
jgi:NAD(P)-dependent dehydrogenase (short-subunit alcohol dehydrogenase family)